MPVTRNNCVCLVIISLLVGTFTYDLLPNPNESTDHNKDQTWYQTKSQVKIDEKEIDRSIAFSIRALDSFKRLEQNILNAEIANHKRLVVSNADEDASTMGRVALIVEKASTHLISRYCYKNKLSSNKCARIVDDYNATSSKLDADLNEICDRLTGQCEFTSSSKYRSVNGACNHMYSPAMGQSFMAYKRLLLPGYLDGVHTPRRSANKKFTLPSARLITNKLIQRDDDALTDKSGKYTLAFAHWGEFIEHDMVHTVTHKMIHFDKSIECCTPDGHKLAPRHLHPFCHAIDVPNDDKFYAKHDVKCLSYVRSMGALRADCSFGPLDQLNQATHYLDASHIYGNELAKAESLRNGIRGQMRTSRNKSFLPKSAAGDGYEGGDKRVNANPQLTALHTVFLREHNRLAETLSQVNPHWDDGKLYNEARRILIAEVQHVTYDEWLPLLLPEEEMRKIMSANDFQEAIDPTVSNSFATAAIRSIKSLIPGNIQLYNEDRTINATIGLADHFYKTHIVEETTDAIELFARGLVTQKTRKLDLSYSQDLVDQIGQDVISLDVQRGRDHGLPGYNSYRKLCGAKEADAFDDLNETIPLESVKLLSQIYGHPNDIDLIIGGLSETPQKGALLGPTFTCLISEQFKRTRNGDRWFHSFGKSFNAEQLKEIEKVTLAKILCANTEQMDRIQAQAFLPISNSNTLKKCHDLLANNINLNVWRR